MESLSENTWDLVIAGTGLAQALLALSLSRSDKKILHVDKNEYYGGFDAAVSLNEAEAWTKKVNQSKKFAKFQHAKIHVPQEFDGTPSKILERSRKYTLSLSPQLIYAQSKLLSVLVSSRVHTQLEFQAVGSWWVHRDKKLHRIPNGREDVFADDTLSRRDKIALMKFLRSMVKEQDAEEHDGVAEEPQEEDDRPFGSLLKEDFRISEALQQPLLALSLSPLSSSSVGSSFAVPRIKRHITSIGAFGPGFGAVLPKYGGNAEIAQVGCRAGAVGGGVYVLGADIIGREPAEDPDHVKVLLSTGETVTTRYVVGGLDDLSNVDWTEEATAKESQAPAWYTHCICIVSSSLKQLFPQTSENGPVPAGAVVCIHDEDDSNASPFYLQVHSEDTGECPSGQCVIYGAVRMGNSSEEKVSRTRLHNAVEQTVLACDANATILWEMSYTSRSLPIENPPSHASFTADPSGHMIAFSAEHEDIAFNDGLLDGVKAVWEKIVGSNDSLDFMRFEERNEDADEE